MKRRKFTKEFKMNVLSEIESGKTIGQVSSEKGISPGVISKWKAQYKSNPEYAFSGNGKISSLESELNECKKVIGELYLEVEFLKKVQKNLQLSLIQKRLKKQEESTK